MNLRPADVLVATARLRPICRWQTAEDALEAFERHDALRDLSLLFVDCHLPGLDGINMVRRIRQLDDGRTLKIVMVSGSQSEGVSGRAIRAGVDRFERKGSTLTDLKNAVARAFDLVQHPAQNCLVRPFAARGAGSPSRH